MADPSKATKGGLELLKDMLVSRPLVIQRRNPMKVLNDPEARFRNLFETGTSGGIDDKEYRAAVENQWWGIDKDAPPHERPTYGLLGHREGMKAAQVYGPYAFVMNPRVKEGATWSPSDSLILMNRDYFPTGQRGEQTFMKEYAPRPFDRALNINDPKAFQPMRDFSPYVEAQMFNRPTMHDVDQILAFPTKPQYDFIDDMKRAADKWEVPVLAKPKDEDLIDWLKAKGYNRGGLASVRSSHGRR